MVLRLKWPTIADTESSNGSFISAILQNKTEVIIEDSIIEELSKKEPAVAGLPDSICMMVKINAASAESIDNENYTLTLQPPSGPSGGNLLGRFCHLNPEIEKLTRSILAEEEANHPDSVFAEIIHLLNQELETCFCGLCCANMRYLFMRCALNKNFKSVGTCWSD